MRLFESSMHSGAGTPQSEQGTPQSDGEASGRDNQSDNEKWEGGAKSDLSEDEEDKRRYSDEERENSDDEASRNRKPGTSGVKGGGNLVRELDQELALCDNLDTLDFVGED